MTLDDLSRRKGDAIENFLQLRVALASVRKVTNVEVPGALRTTKARQKSKKRHIKNTAPIDLVVVTSFEAEVEENVEPRDDVSSSESPSSPSSTWSPSLPSSPLWPSSPSSDLPSTWSNFRVRDEGVEEVVELREIEEC
jgi:hypothetical protein